MGGPSLGGPEEPGEPGEEVVWRASYRESLDLSLAPAVFVIHDDGTKDAYMRSKDNAFESGHGGPTHGRLGCNRRENLRGPRGIRESHTTRFRSGQHDAS